MQNNFELAHHYGPQVHILQSPFLSGLLAKLCSPETFQPQINQLVDQLYYALLMQVMNNEFANETFKQPTRMTALHPHQFLEGTRLNPQQKVVSVNIARAGTFPSHICYQALHYAIEPQNLRQDHIFASRMTDDREQVTHSALSGMKIGGDVKDAIVIYPDPMGATGNTIVSAVEFYKTKVKGPAKKYISLQLIVTPEFLRNVLKAHPDLTIYALRVDRGLSPQDVLKSPAGLHWDLERGLNDKDYIVPGGGGFGEIMNNSFV